FPNRAFYPPLAVLDPIPREAPWRFTAASFLFVPNVSALYELEDVRGYEAMTFAPLTRTFPLWCVPQPVWFNRVDDPERPFLSFLNVRWVLVPAQWDPPPGWKTLAEGDDTKLVENPRALPRAFAPRALRVEATDAAAIGALQSINDFGEHGVVDGRDVAWPAGEWRPNGEASVTIDSYRPQRLELSVNAASRAVVGTSIPRWPGWKLEIDGKSAPLLGYNDAFIGFEAPAGRSRAVLRYWPDGFVWGTALTLATLAGCVLTPRILRRRLRPAPPYAPRERREP
ncbi:MAG TPA: YfhO family protein, partial [Thermoanaerobaculia bacterium]|nr:YfhO family protein [Thermoanaerobaculia bacterium]